MTAVKYMFKLHSKLNFRRRNFKSRSMKYPMAIFLALFIGAMYFEMASSCWCSDKDSNPQCGKNKDGKEVTYLNPCTLTCDGAELIKAGECENPACSCFKIYHRVCGQKGGSRVNYDNDCEMKCDGATFANHGRCGIKPCICLKEEAPVCGKKGDKYMEYGNKCSMGCDGAELVHEGPCVVD